MIPARTFVGVICAVVGTICLVQPLCSAKSIVSESQSNFLQRDHLRQYDNTICVTKLRSSIGSAANMYISENSTNVLVHKCSTAEDNSVKISNTLEEDFFESKVSNLKLRSSVFQPCELSSCPLCKRNNHISAVQRQLPFKLFCQ
jgi:hypothetical protein